VVSFKVDVIFEELGFKYFGPIDGHNIPLIMSTLHHTKEVPGPVLIHVITKKGKGYLPAEKQPSRFHGIGPFEATTGKSLNDDATIAAPPSYTSVFGKTVVQLAKENPRVIAITAAMVDGTGLEEFARNFPERFFDVGIAEEHAVEFAAGLAISGFRPLVAVYSTFLQRAYDQIIHDVCLQNLPVVFCLDRGGIVGEDGPTHHGLFDLAYLRFLPNLVVMAPSNEDELQHMLATAVKHPGPIALRYPRGAGPGVELAAELKKIKIGKSEIIYTSSIASRPSSLVPRPSSSLVIIAIGSMVYPSIEAAKLLEKDGLSVTVINARFARPLDRELLLKAAKAAERMVTVEEGVLEGGFGSAVLELLSEEKINLPVDRIGLPSKFIEHGKREELLEKYGLTAEGIYQRVMKKTTPE
jgi:1-deoxy-D-xylulose-5-phosphate synthase